jgi:NADH dehydrogenase FAD-containing subunit
VFVFIGGGWAGAYTLHRCGISMVRRLRVSVYMVPEVRLHSHLAASA